MTHPLAQVVALAKADGRSDFQLFTAPEDGRVRLNIPTANLWVMCAQEDGALMDRQMALVRKTFVKLGEDDIARGAASIYAMLGARADRIISDIEETE